MPAQRIEEAAVGERPQLDAAPAQGHGHHVPGRRNRKANGRCRELDPQPLGSSRQSPDPQRPVRPGPHHAVARDPQRLDWLQDVSQDPGATGRRP